jgi:hypothetical protein
VSPLNYWYGIFRVRRVGYNARVIHGALCLAAKRISGNARVCLKVNKPSVRELQQLRRGENNTCAVLGSELESTMLDYVV